MRAPVASRFMKQEALIGRTVAGKYEIEALVGQGAMGSVYRVRQTTLGTTLALKILHRQLAGEPMFAARFLREAQAASRVDHPSSMRVVDFGEEPDGLLYIAMEYVDGKTLARIIEDDSPLPVVRIVDIACQALAALAVAHDLGVIHRDLKPENIMVLEGKDDEGRTHDIVKVCDFGVAKLLQGGSRAPSVTAEGVVVGTPEYMSPEQARGEALDARSDIYAMGVLLFHLMTGKVPFDSSTAFGTALMHVNDEPTRPRLLNPRVDSRLEKICLKAMRKRPDDRHGSARELRAELRALIGHEDEEDAMEERNDKSRDGVPASLLAQIDARPRRSGLVMAGVVLAATALAGFYLYPRHGAPAPPREPVQTATVTSAVVPTAPRTPSVEAPPPVAAAEAPSPEAIAPAPRPRGAHARRGKGHAAASIAIGEEIPPLPDPPAKGTAAPDRAAETKPGAEKPNLATKPDAKPTAAKPGATLAGGSPKMDAKPADTKPADAKPADAKPGDAKPADAKPADAKPADAKPADAKPAKSTAKPDPADAPLPNFPIPADGPPTPRTSAHE